MTKKLVFALLASVLISASCGTGFKDISTSNGRQAIIDQANDFLTAGDCDNAIAVLTPLYNSQYVDYETRMVYASAYACKGGFSFTNLIAALASPSFDIWSSLVAADYSVGTDSKQSNLLRAADIVRQTSPMTDSTTQAHYLAQYRTPEANLYMIFLQTAIIATTISPPAIGNAYRATGKKGQSITGKGANSDKCAIELALATIYDSLSYVSSGGSSLNSIKSSINTVCSGGCSSMNLVPSVCTATEQTEGATLIIGINAAWTQGP